MEKRPNNWLKIIMFKQRLLTTLILVPLVLMAIYYASVPVLGILVLLLTVLLGWEWSQLIPIKKPMYKCIFIAIMLLLIWPAVHWLHYWLLADVIFWGLILIAVLSYPASQSVWGHRIIVGAGCLFLLPLVASTMSSLYQQTQGKDLIVYLLCLIWAADIGAYLAGKQWGRCKLIPRVSPGKTIEGSLGGIGLALLIAGVGFIYFKPEHVVTWFVVAALTALVSMLGDLFISMLKRRSQVKDTGNILPGHGGILDRLDSLIAALPLFYLAHTVHGISQGL